MKKKVEPNNEVEGQESQLHQLQQAHGDRSRKIQALETKRRSYIVAARASKNADAQSEIEHLAAEINALQREDLDDSAAIDQLSEELAARKTEEQRAEVRAQFASLRAAVESRLDCEEEREAVALAEKLLQKLSHLREINEKSNQVLSEAKLYKEGQRFGALPEANGAFLSAYLRDVIPSPLNWQWIELCAPRSAPEILTKEACESALKALASAEAKAMEQIGAG